MRSISAALTLLVWCACANPGVELGRCAASLDCPQGFYCARELGHCEDESGACRRRPDVCIELYQPVCGCDGRSYSNACKAAAAGISVQGQCPNADRDGADVSRLKATCQKT